MSFVSGLLALTWFAAAIRSEKCVCFLQMTSVLIITEGFFFSDWNGVGSSAVDGFDLNGKQHISTARPIQQSGGEC